MSRLKLCPFCGKKPEINQRYDVIDWDEDDEPIEELRYVIECENDNCTCYVESKSYPTEEEVIKAWNTRKPMEAVIKQYKWERDMALYQLEQLGIGFGQKLEDEVIEKVKEVIRCD